MARQNRKPEFYGNRQEELEQQQREQQREYRQNAHDAHPQHIGGGSTEPNNDEAERRKRNLLENLRPAFSKLEMEPTLHIKEAQKQFKKKALIHHPDKGNPAQFRAIKEAVDKITAAVEDYRKRFMSAS